MKHHVPGKGLQLLRGHIRNLQPLQVKHVLLVVGHLRAYTGPALQRPCREQRGILRAPIFPRPSSRGARGAQEGTLSQLTHFTDVINSSLRNSLWQAGGSLSTCG